MLIPRRLAVAAAAVLILAPVTVVFGRQGQPARPATQTQTQTQTQPPAQGRPATAAAQPGRLTSPMQEFGHNFGDDYWLANYQQISTWWKKLDQESDRMQLVDIGETAEGRRQYMAIISDPANMRNLARYKQIATQLAHAEGLTDAQARALAQEGKAVVWIDGGLHASETLGAQQLGETVWQLVSRNDSETQRILRDVVILCVHVNPDGNDLVANWYMRNADTLRRTLSGLPELYQKYTGHDDNRDYFASTQKETENENRIMYREWYPEIMYNHHQAGPAGAVMFSPPFRDPPNYNFDPMILTGLELVGGAIHNRMAAEGKGGVVKESGAPYSTWFNGGIRTTSYFHNMIGILTETIGGPTPQSVPFVPRYQVPTGDSPMPVQTGMWHFRQSIDYSITANWAVLDIASRYRETFLYNIYVMGKRAIDKGSKDSWTITPHRLAAVQSGGAGAAPATTTPGGGGGGLQGDALERAFKSPTNRDPRGYIVSADQPDFPTATKFINALLENGITIKKATAPFTVNGKTYPANSYVVPAAQAFRAHVMDMFEPQDHPDDFAYPGAPPTQPYDITGYTLAFTTGTQFDRILDNFPATGPFQTVTDWNIKAPVGRVGAAQGATGYFFTHQQNDAFTAINRLERAGEEVFWLRAPVTANGKTYPAGTFYVTAKPTTAALLQKAATDLGVSFDATSARPTGDAFQLKKVRLGLFDQYGGSMDAGWTRWVLEQFEFDFDRVFPPTLDQGNLNSKYDALVFMNGGLVNGPAPAAGGVGAAPAAGGRGGAGAAPQGDADLPPEYRGQRGNVTAGITMPRIKEFLDNGGTVFAGGSAARNIAGYLRLPIGDALEVNGVALSEEKFYVPGSVLRAHVDNTQPLAQGLPDQMDVFFDSSPTFKLLPGADAAGIRRVAWFEGKTPLRSGWAWGQQYLDGGVGGIDVPVGKGHLFLFGFDVNQRAQTHASFKFLFNGIYYGSATPTRM